MQPITDTGEFINGRQACQIIGCAPSALLRAAMIGEVEVKLDPGVAPRYRRQDCERLAQSRVRAVGNLQLAGA
jgi:hypothetical protein